MSDDEFNIPEPMGKLVIAITAVFVGSVIIGGLVSLWDAGKEYGRRMQFNLDNERAKKKGFEL